MTQETLKQKLESIVALAEECLQDLASATPIKRRSAQIPAESEAKDMVLPIVNKVGDCDEATAIQKAVLDSRAVEGRVLLPFYISHKYFGNEWLTSGDVEKVTSDLGVKIDKKNVANHVITYRKYLESGATRKKGQPTPYRLNRNGVKRFEEIISTFS